MRGLPTSLPTYTSLIRELAEDAPQVALVLSAAEDRRRANLTRLGDGIRCIGLKELFPRLDNVTTAFAEIPELAKLVFMINGAQGDYATACCPQAAARALVRHLEHAAALAPWSSGAGLQTPRTRPTAGLAHSAGPSAADGRREPALWVPQDRG